MKHTSSNLLFCAVLTALTAVPAFATNGTWGNTGTDWNTNGSWTSSTPPTSSGTAIFSGAEVTNPNVSAPTAVGQINFSSAASSGYTITSGSGNTVLLTLNNSVAGTGGIIYAQNTTGTNTINADLFLGATAGSSVGVVQQVGGTLVINGDISGNAGNGITYNYNTGTGSATIILGGNSTYTGNTIISGTPLLVEVSSIGNSGASGNLGAGTAIVLNKGTMEYMGGGETTSKAIQVNAGGVINGAGSGGLVISGNVTTVTAATTGTLSLTGTSTVTNKITGNISDGSGALAIGVTGGNWALSGNNTYSGGGSVSGGATLDINSVTALGSGNGTWNFASGSTIDNSSGGALTLTTSGTETWNSTSLTFVGSNSLNLGTGSVVINGSSLVVTVDTGINTGTLTVGGAIGDNGAGKGFAKSGSGVLVLNGVNTYTGATLDNLGTLALGGGGSLSTGTVAVGNATVSAGVSGNATLQINGNYTIGTTTGGVLNVKGGNGTSSGQGTLSTVDGTTNTLTLANNSAVDVLSIGSTTTGNSSVLNMEVGAASDEISVGSGTGKVLVLSGATAGTTKNTVNITGLGGLNGTTQTLIAGTLDSTTSGHSTYSNGFVLGTTSGNFGGYTVALVGATSALTLTETANASPTGAVYWYGAAAGVTGGSTAWNSFENGNTNTSNFSTSATASSATNATGLLGAASDVNFNATSGVVTGSSSTTLGQNFTIDSLTFNTGGVSVAAGGTNTLTINTSTNGAANGISVTATSGSTDTITAPVVLGNAQTWSVNSGDTLAINGAVNGASNLLTLGGTGTVALNGTLTGSASMNSGANLSGTGTVTGSVALTGTNTLSSSGTLTTSSISVGGSGNAISSGAVDGAVTINSGGGLTVTGTLVGTGSLTVNGGGTLGGTGAYGTTAHPGSGFSISGTGTSTASRANVLVGLNSGSDTNTIKTLTLVGSSTSTITNANLTFNLSATTVGQGTELSVGSTLVAFGTGTGSVQLTLNLQNEPAIVPPNSQYVLIAGTLPTGGGGLNGSQYSGLTGGAVLINSGGITETVINNNNLQLAFGTSLDQQFYGTGSYLVLYQNTNLGIDDIDVVVVPEPGTWVLMLSGLVTLIIWQRRKGRS